MSIALKNIFSQYKNIAKNSFFLCVVDGIKMLLPFIAMPYIIGICGAENYGRIIFAQTITAYFSILVNFGLNIVLVKDISDNIANFQIISSRVSELLGVRLLLTAAGAIILTVVICTPIEKDLKYLLIFSYVAVIADALNMTAFFQGIEKMHNITVIQFTAVVFYLISLFAFVRTAENYLLVPLLQSLGLLFAALVGITVMCKKYEVHFSFPSLSAVLSLFKRSVPFALSRVSVTMNANIARFFAGVTLGMQEVAILDLAQKISDAALLPSTILDQAIYPHNAKQKDRLFATQTFWVMLLCGFLCAGIMIAGTPWAVNFLGKGQLNAAIPITCYLAIKVVVNVMVYYTGTPLLVAFGYPKPFNYSVITAMIAMLMSYVVLYVCNLLSLNIFVVLLIACDGIILIYRLFYCIKYNILVFRRVKK